MSEVATHLHRMIEVADTLPDDRHGVKAMLAVMTRTPIFVITKEVMVFADSPTLQPSLWAMVEAGVARLPYPEMVIEYEPGKTVSGQPVRALVLLKQLPGMEVQASLVAMHADTNGGRILRKSRVPVEVALQPGNFSFSKTFDDYVMDCIGVAIEIALLLVMTRGIERHPVDIARLNKRRQERGKIAIPNHSIIRIGRVVTRDGRSIPYDPRSSMPIHWRRGHVRNQFYGPGRSQHRPVYIEPVLVNYKPGDEAPTVAVPQRLVKL